MPGMSLNHSLELRHELRLEQRIALRTEFAHVLEVSRDELANRVEQELEDNFMLERDYSDRVSRNPDFERWQDYRINSITKPDSLQSVLLHQLHLMELDERIREIGETLIANIGDNGYLEASCEEIAEELDVAGSEVEKVLTYVQQFEPAGIGARDLKECLCIQIAAEPSDNGEELCTLVEEHLETLAEDRLEHIAESMSISVRHVIRFKEQLQKLNPKPGVEYGAEDISYIVPEVIVEDEDGIFVVYLADDIVQGLRLNSDYSSAATHSCTDKQRAKEIAKKRQAAKQFISLLEL